MASPGAALPLYLTMSRPPHDSSTPPNEQTSTKQMKNRPQALKRWIDLDESIGPLRHQRHSSIRLGQSPSPSVLKYVSLMAWPAASPAFPLHAPQPRARDVGEGNHRTTCPTSDSLLNQRINSSAIPAAPPYTCRTSTYLPPTSSSPSTSSYSPERSLPLIPTRFRS